MNQNNSLAMFENESIGKLMIKFSLPAIASMVVNSIYNIVDQIFIGQGVGMYGNAATNLTLPSRLSRSQWLSAHLSPTAVLLTSV